MLNSVILNCSTHTFGCLATSSADSDAGLYTKQTVNPFFTCSVTLPMLSKFNQLKFRCGVFSSNVSVSSFTAFTTTDFLYKLENRIKNLLCMQVRRSFRVNHPIYAILVSISWNETFCTIIVVRRVQHWKILLNRTKQRPCVFWSQF